MSGHQPVYEYISCRRRHSQCRRSRWYSSFPRFSFAWSYSHNASVFLPFDSRKHMLLPRSAAARPLDAAVKPNSPHDSGMERTNSSSSSNLYCTACKKKFSNEATWSTHLKSAKHIQNEKVSAKSTNVQLSASQRTSK